MPEHAGVVAGVHVDDVDEPGGLAGDLLQQQGGQRAIDVGLAGAGHAFAA